MTFKAVVLGVRYTDRAEFERAARAAGWRSGASEKRGGRTGDWRVGLPVAFKTDSGVTHHGQVWSKAASGATEGPGVIIALNSGAYARVNTHTLRGQMIDAWGRPASPAVRGGVPKVGIL